MDWSSEREVRTDLRVAQTRLGSRICCSVAAVQKSSALLLGYGTRVCRRSTAGASRLAALLVAHMLPIFSGLIRRLPRRSAGNAELLQQAAGQSDRWEWKRCGGNRSAMMPAVTPSQQTAASGRVRFTNEPVIARRIRLANEAGPRNLRRYCQSIHRSRRSSRQRFIEERVCRPALWGYLKRECLTQRRSPRMILSLHSTLSPMQ